MIDRPYSCVVCRRVKVATQGGCCDICWPREKAKYDNDQAGTAKSETNGPQANGKPSAPADHVWQDPLPIPEDMPPVLPFDFDVLPNAFAPFVRDVAERMQCPPDFCAVAIMVALGGVVGKKIGIRPKRQDDWLVVPNLWGGVVGRPGIMKSAAIAEPFKFLYRSEAAAKERFQAELDNYEIKCIVAEERKKIRKDAIATAVKEGGDPEKAAQQFPIEEPTVPARRRYVVNDSTVEKVGMLLNENPNGLTALRDELTGLLEQLDRDGQEGSRAFYLEAWDGRGRFTYDRVQRGTIEIESVTLSVFGGIQPGKLASYLKSALQGGAGDDGMMQRFQLLVYPDVDKKWRNVDRWPDTEAKQKAWAVFQAMDNLNALAVGADLDGDVPFLRFDHEAQQLFDDWRAQLEARVRSGDDHLAIESHLAKYRSLVPTLALLIHLADGGIGPVTLTATEKSLAWARYLESHARRIYGIVIDPTNAAAKALVKHIANGDLQGGFTARELYRKAWAGLDRESTELAIELLIDLHWLTETTIQTDGRCRTDYVINPKVHVRSRGAGTDKADKTVSDDPSGSSVSDHPGHFAAENVTDPSGSSVSDQHEHSVTEADTDWGEI